MWCDDGITMIRWTVQEKRRLLIGCRILCLTPARCGTTAAKGKHSISTEQIKFVWVGSGMKYDYLLPHTWTLKRIHVHLTRHVGPIITNKITTKLLPTFREIVHSLFFGSLAILSIFATCKLWVDARNEHHIITNVIHTKNKNIAGQPKWLVNEQMSFKAINIINRAAKIISPGIKRDRKSHSTIDMIVFYSLRRSKCQWVDSVADHQADVIKLSVRSSTFIADWFLRCEFCCVGRISLKYPILLSFSRTPGTHVCFFFYYRICCCVRRCCFVLNWRCLTFCASLRSKLNQRRKQAEQFHPNYRFFSQPQKCSVSFKLPTCEILISYEFTSSL